MTMERHLVRMRHGAPGGVLIAVLVVFAIQLRAEYFITPVMVSTLGAAAALWLTIGLALRARAWRVVDTPISKVRAATVGECEFSGAAQSPSPQAAPGSGTTCAWYRWELQRYVRRGRSSHWRTEEKMEFSQPFWLTDETGSIWVDPHNADFDGIERHTLGVVDRPGKWRQLEWLIPQQSSVYILGPVSATVDGHLVVSSGDDNSADFLISDDSQRTVANRLGRWAWASLTLGAIAAVLATLLRDRRELNYSGEEHRVPTMSGSHSLAIVVGVAYLAFLLVTWVVRVYNRLVLTRNQAEKAWASIEVQLQRRHDLIANLVLVVQKYGQYERQTLVDVTTARGALPTDAEVEAANEADTASHAEGSELLALSEKYPQLHADEQFTKLSAALTDTENRIALAREFYNDAVNLMRDRRGTLPYALLAPLVPIPSLELFGGSSQPQVTFAFGSGIRTHA
jgi:LemA protein